MTDEIKALKAERDAAVRELELVTAERNRAHRACEQISVRLHAAMAECDAAALAERKACVEACESVEQITESQSWVVSNCIEAILERGKV